MLFNKISWILLLQFFLVLTVFSQQKTDSINSILSNKRLSDSEKINALIKMGNQLENADTAKALKYFLTSFELSKKINSASLTAQSAGNIGVLYSYSKNYKKEIEYLLLSLKYLENLFDSTSLERKRFAYLSVGWAYFQTGVYALALKNYFNAAKLAEKYLKSSNLEDIEANIGEVYLVQKKYSLAKEYYNRALGPNIAKHDTGDIAGIYLAIGNLFFYQEKYDSALSNYMKSAELEQMRRDTNSLCGVYINIGYCYLKKNKSSIALQYISDAIQFNRPVDPVIDAEASQMLGRIYRVNKQYSKSLINHLRAIKIADEYDLVDISKDSYEELSLAYKGLNDYKNAFESYKKFSELDDSLLNIENTRQLNELQVVYETEKKEQENAALIKDNKIQKLEIEKQVSFRIFLYFVLFFLSLMLISFWLLYKKESRTNFELNAEIENYKASTYRLNKLFEKHQDLTREKMLKKAILEEDVHIFKQYLKASLDLIEKSEKFNETKKIKTIREDIKRYIAKIKSSINLVYQDQAAAELREIEQLLSGKNKTTNKQLLMFRKQQLFLFLNIFVFLLTVTLIFYLGWDVMDKWTYIAGFALVLYDLILLKKISSK